MGCGYLSQQPCAPERDLGNLLLHDAIGVKIRHPVDECDPQVIWGEIVSGYRFKPGTRVGSSKGRVFGTLQEGPRRVVWP